MSPSPTGLAWGGGPSPLEHQGSFLTSLSQSSRGTDLSLDKETTGEACWGLLGKAPFSKAEAGRGEASVGSALVGCPELLPTSCYSTRSSGKEDE